MSAAYAFKDSPFAIKLDYCQDAYVTSDSLTSAFGNHYTRFTTIDGGTALTPVFLARQSALDARLEFHVAVTGGSTSGFSGTILAQASISLGPGSTVNGRLLARTGGVTLLSDPVITPGP